MAEFYKTNGRVSVFRNVGDRPISITHLSEGSAVWAQVAIWLDAETAIWLRDTLIEALGNTTQPVGVESLTVTEQADEAAGRE